MRHCVVLFSFVVFFMSVQTLFAQTQAKKEFADLFCNCGQQVYGGLDKQSKQVLIDVVGQANDFDKMVANLSKLSQADKDRVDEVMAWLDNPKSDAEFSACLDAGLENFQSSMEQVTEFSNKMESNHIEAFKLMVGYMEYDANDTGCRFIKAVIQMAILSEGND
ncbi:MAG: hypothetical protein JJT94_09480 [Bernardetiaceae bacterium]|nr:hypothetical protein [Bernardetiaceae bacterium]